MLNPPRRRWPQPEQVDGLLFFAQKMEEMLFDYSRDSYRVPALNTRLRCKELLITINQIQAGLIKSDSSLTPMLEELAWSIKNDQAAKDLLVPYQQLLFKQLESRPIDRDILKPHLEHVEAILNKAYYIKIKEEITRIVTTSPNEKQLLAKYARSYATEIVSKGCTKQTAYFKIKTFFFGRRTFTASTKVKDFFALFNFLEEPPGRWTVIFRGTPEWAHLKNLPYEDLFAVAETAEETEINPTQSADFFSDNQQFPLFLIVKGMDAHEAFLARDMALSLLEAFRSMAHYYNHKTKLEIWEKSLAFLEVNDICTQNKPIYAIMKRPDVELENLCEEIQGISDSFLRAGMKEETTRAVFSALELHSAALRAPRTQEQLLNLWTALESFIPSSNKSIINNIIASVVPLLCNCYPSNLLKHLYRTLERTRNNNIRQQLDRIEEGDNIVEKAAALVSLDKYEDTRSVIYGELASSPLLRYRLFSISSKMNTGKHLLQLVTDHENRVSWQIHRIYRMRNLIIHAGGMMPYLDILVENLHIYFDVILREVSNRIERRSTIQRIDQILWEADRDYTDWKRMLHKFGNSLFSEDNYALLILGAPVSPPI